MSRWPRRAFLFGAWMTIATGGLHALAHLGPPPPPSGPVAVQLRELATTHKQHILGVDRTLMNFMDGFSVSFSVMALAWGGASIFLARRVRDDPQGLRPAAIFNALLAAGMLAISAIYFVPPPTVCFALVTAGYLLALLPARTGAG